MQILANAIRTGFLAAIISLGVGSAAVAGPYEDAWDAYNRGDFETALRLIQPLADQGDASAQYSLGVMYGRGEGVPKKPFLNTYQISKGVGASQRNIDRAENFAEAVKWYRKAADQGYAKAQYNLGVMYDKGEGVAENDAEAVKWERS